MKFAWIFLKQTFITNTDFVLFFSVLIVCLFVFLLMLLLLLLFLMRTEGYKVIYYPIPASLLQPGNVKPTNTASIKITSTSTGGATVCPEPQNKGQSSCQGCPNNSISQTPTCTPGISVNCGRRLSFTYITKNITNATANSSPSPQTSSSVGEYVLYRKKRRDRVKHKQAKWRNTSHRRKTTTRKQAIRHKITI